MTPVKIRNLLAGVCLVAAMGLAQQSRINRPIDVNQRALVANQVHPKARAEFDQGRVAADFFVPFVTVTLDPTDAQRAELDAFLAEQQTAGSPNYHRWLSPEEFAQRFGVSEADVAQVTNWLQSQGLTVVATSRSRTWIAVSGAAAKVEAAFATELHHYQVNGERHFANATAPSVPEALGTMVRSIRGLNDFRMRPAKRLQNRSLQPDFTTSRGSHNLAPDDLATIYNIQGLYAAGADGTGQSLVIAGQTAINVSDIQLFRSTFSLPAKDPQIIRVPNTTDPGISQDDLAEADLDIEWSGAVARNA